MNDLAKILALTLSLLVIIPAFGATDRSVLKTIHEVQSLTTNFVSFVEETTCSKERPKNCKKPLTSLQIEKFKEIIMNLAQWKVVSFGPESEKVDVLKGKKFLLLESEETSITESEKLMKISLSPKDSANLLSQVKSHAALNLALYESFISVARTLSDSPKIRAILQYDMLFEDRVLSEIYRPVTGSRLWTVIKYDLRLIQALSKSVKDPSKDPSDEFLNSSWVMKEIHASKKFQRWIESTGFRLDMEKSSFAERGKRILSSLSQIFGNTVGKVSFRAGKLKSFARDESFMKSFKTTLKPMDILFEKTPFRLTDKFIPGHFGHAAIWLGSLPELQQMKVEFEGKLIPLLSHPEVAPFRNQILEGKLVVESLRHSGVTMNSLESFFNVDDLVVMRPKSLTDIPELILRVLRQVGKPYDFNFDVETDRSIICTELITAVLTDWEWPSTFTFGRFTVSPDDVMMKALALDFSVIQLYLKGKRIDTDPALELLRVLKIQ